MEISLISQNKVCGGWHKRYKHQSSCNQCDMTFAVFLPPQVEQGDKVPVIYWLSGLTCTDENFMQKAGAFKLASELGIAIVAPDTSPRGSSVADEPDSYDFGQGAGFYLDATQMPYARHYNMYSYVTSELPSLIQAHFSVNGKQAISGHSMGGHGALTIGLKNSEMFTSISAFSPICNPTETPWGIKAFSNYLGSDKGSWLDYDATALLAKAQHVKPIMIEQGADDDFLEKELTPEALLSVAEERGIEISFQCHPGYDHSYFFISSFIDKHLRFHAQHLLT